VPPGKMSRIWTSAGSEVRDPETLTVLREDFDGGDLCRRISVSEQAL
jgi:hypothetical protein